MHVLILGGDGYLGWPTALYFSERNHEVTVVDNYFRRNSCHDSGLDMLYPVPLLSERARIWHQKTGREIKVVIGDLADPRLMRSLFGEGAVHYDWQAAPPPFDLPECVVHYAEQPSAPYSMVDYQHANFTIQNNLLVTNNLMFAVRDLSPGTHIIKIGSMGEYGTPNIDIEEGWIEIVHKGRKERFLFPRQASSLYHTTKIMDTDLLWFGVRMWQLRVTDLMQGPVYGIETVGTRSDLRLRTLFNYDEIFGTILNRFVVQAVAGYPLTVYGRGGQTRGYININDTLQCVYLSAQKPAQPAELRIFNQIMETFSASEIAERVQRVGRSLGYSVEIDNVDNPRKEAEEHYYNPTYQGLRELGVKPHLLTDEFLSEMFALVGGFKDNIRRDIIFNGVKW
jgi:UDP-sulfoquinovose synthase